MKIKICGITEKKNLEELIQLSPDYLGFIFYPASERFMGDKLKSKDLMNIPGKIKKVGVFVNSDSYEVDGIYWKYNLDYVQLHGDESPAFCRILSKSGIQIIKAFRLDEHFDFEQLMEYMPHCKYFLFDTHSHNYGGSGQKFNWEILKNYHLGQSFLLSGGIGPFDADELMQIKQVSFIGIDLNSRFEVRPGIKDINKLKIFFQKLRQR